MAPPIYFFPAVRLEQLTFGHRLNAKRLADYGLAEVFSDVEDVRQHCRQDLTGAGPGGHSGAMFCTTTGGQPPLRFGYHPDFQTWTKVRNEPELWLGVDREHPPTPEDLVRPRTVPGYRVRLADGNMYEVPVIRSLNPTGPTNLPRDMYYDAEGEFCVELKAGYRQLWEDTGVVWDMLYEGAEIRYEDLLKLCVRFVGVNYRYGRAEQAVLRLVDATESTWAEICKAAVDVPFVDRYEAAQKKSEPPAVPPGPSSEPGQPADTRATEPAEESSL